MLNLIKLNGSSIIKHINFSNFFLFKKVMDLNGLVIVIDGGVDGKVSIDKSYSSSPW